MFVVFWRGKGVLFDISGLYQVDPEELRTPAQIKRRCGFDTWEIRSSPNQLELINWALEHPLEPKVLQYYESMKQGAESRVMQ